MSTPPLPTASFPEDLFNIISESAVWWETIYDPSGQILFMSKACEKITGYSPVEFRQDSGLMLGIIHPGDKERVEKHFLQEPGSEKGVSNLEFRICSKSGETKWITHECVGVFNSEGQYLGKRVTNIEQTAIRKVLQEHPGTDGAPGLIRDGSIEDTSAHFFDSFVISLAHSLGLEYVFIAENIQQEKPLLKTVSLSEQRKIIPGIELEPDQTLIDQVFKCRQSTPFTSRIDFHAGSLFHSKGMHYLSGVPLLDNRKKPIGLLAAVSAREFSNAHLIEETFLGFANWMSAQLERAQTEALIRQSEEKYKLIVENQTDLVVKTDQIGRLLFVSPSYCESFGKKDNEILGEYFPPLKQTGEQIESPALQSLFHPPYTCYLEQQAMTSKGMRWIGWNNKAIPDEVLGVKEIIAIGRDITDKKLAEIELLQAKQRAEESDRLKTAFLANMSHEIRTPMNSILGFSGLLGRENIVPEKKKQYIEIIQNSTRQLLTVINDIIDIAKIEAGQITLAPEEVNLNKICSQILVFYDSERRIRNKIQVSVSFIPELDDQHAELITDGVRLQQILTNLLSNALKFTESGYIRFGYRIQSSNTLLFFVEDTGKGIAEEKQQVIFQRFRQEEESFSRQYGGTGLGLSICKGLIDLFKGKIWVESTRDQGSVFYFTIPYQPAGTFKPRQEEPEMGYKWNEKTILIAEDTKSNLFFITELLADTECRILHAEHGKKAIELIQEYPGIDLVLMDIQMPVMNGYDATREIRKFNMNIPVIAQTAYAMSEDREKCLNAGCNDYLAKPFDRASLLKLLDQYLA